MKILLIALFGSLGVLTRHLIDTVLPNSGTLPWGTLLSNTIGCFAIGILFAQLQVKTPGPYLIPLMVGFCGGLTTFSSYSLQSFERMINGEWIPAVTYMVIAPLIGLLFVYLGHTSAQ
jgi:CrcB protein